MDKQQLTSLKITAQKIRKHVITGTYHAQSGHPGGSLSIADLLALLYFNGMRVDPHFSDDPNRDRFILSKGHCAPAYYGALAERGYFDPREIEHLRQAGSFLQGHPARTTPGVDACSGSLGQGLSVGAGMAIAALKEGMDYRVYVVLGDGELEEGQVWEAAMCAAHYRLDHLTAFIDFNGLQIDGPITDVLSPMPIDEKFRAFGWNVIPCDGHDFAQLAAALEAAKHCQGRPSVILMKTIKGKGISFMENNVAWHGAAPNAEQFQQAMQELDASIAALEMELA
jgi:transketolase